MVGISTSGRGEQVSRGQRAIERSIGQRNSREVRDGEEGVGVEDITLEEALQQVPRHGGRSSRSSAESRASIREAAASSIFDIKEAIVADVYHGWNRVTERRRERQGGRAAGGSIGKVDIQ